MEITISPKAEEIHIDELSDEVMVSLNQSDASLDYRLNIASGKKTTEKT